MRTPFYHGVNIAPVFRTFIPQRFSVIDNPVSQMDSGRHIDLIAALQRHWRLIALGLCFGGLAAVIYNATASRKYESHIEVLVGQRSSETTSTGTISDSQTGDSMGQDQLATHMRLFVAPKVLTAAIRDGRLEQYPGFGNVAAEGGSMVDYLLDNITVDRGGEGNASGAMVLTASFECGDAQEAAATLAAVYASYKRYTENQGDDSAELAVELIEAARETHEQELRDAERTYRDYVAEMPVLLEGEQTKEIHRERLVKLETELAKVRSKASEANSRLRVIEAEIEKNNALAQTDPTMADLNRLSLLSENEMNRLRFFMDVRRGTANSASFQADQTIRVEAAQANFNRLLDLIQREKTFSDSLGAGHPMVESLRNEIDVTRKFIEDHQPQQAVSDEPDMRPGEMLDTFVKLLRHDIAEWAGRERGLIADSRKEMVLAKSVEAEFMKAASLEKQMDRAQQRYDSVIHRLQELNLSRSYAGLSTDLLAPPLVAKKPSWPIVPLVLALGVFVGGLGGGSLAIAAELMDCTFTSVEDLEAVTRSNVVTHVPRMNLRKMRQKVGPDSALDPSLVTFHDPRGTAAEIYRVGRTALMISARKSDASTLMMTSPQPGDGKSTTISNLSISIAGTGKRVLLIDADMRRPMISNLFGLPKGDGLADVLRGQTEVKNAIRKTEVDGLFVMPHGGTTDEPAELLESPNFAAMMRRLATHFDYVLVDAPPVLAVTDPAIVATTVDALVLTVRVTKNGRGIVEDAMRIVDDIGVTPLGVVVNGVDKSATRSYGYEGYGRNKYGYVAKYHAQYQSKEQTVADGGSDGVHPSVGGMAPIPKSRKIAATKTADNRSRARAG